MNPFTVLEKRGAVIDVSSVGSVAPKSGDYDEGRGPRGDRRGAPRDLERSRRVGLSRTVCADCGGAKGEAAMRHKPGCTSSERRRETTGPLDAASPRFRVFTKRGQTWTTIDSSATSTSKESGWR